MRITKEHKADILRSALAFKFKDEEKAIEEGRRLLGDAVYQHAFGEYEAQARAMPKGWISFGRGVSIRCDGYRYDGWKEGTFRYDEDERRYETRIENLQNALPLSKDCPLPACLDKEVKIDNKHPLWKQAWGLVQKHRKLLEARRELERKIKHLLMSVTTLKQLKEAWPEGKRFFPAEVKYSTALVPVGLSDQINKALGLPEKADPATKAVRKAATKEKA